MAAVTLVVLPYKIHFIKILSMPHTVYCGIDYIPVSKIKDHYSNLRRLGGGGIIAPPGGGAENGVGGIFPC